jgi:hypothetical protein
VPELSTASSSPSVKSRLNLLVLLGAGWACWSYSDDKDTVILIIQFLLQNPLLLLKISPDTVR